MNLEQLSALKHELAVAVDGIALEIVRLSTLHKQWSEILAKISAAMDAQVAAAEASVPAKSDYVPTEKADKAALAKAAVKQEEKPVQPAKSTPIKPVSSSARPTLKQSLVAIIGNKAMSADECLEELKKRGLVPNAADPRGYVAHKLSVTKDLFARVRENGRTLYKLIPGVTAPTRGGRRARATSVSAEVPVKKVAKAVKTPTKNSKSDNDILLEMGIKPNAVAGSLNG